MIATASMLRSDITPVHSPIRPSWGRVHTRRGALVRYVIVGDLTGVGDELHNASIDAA